MKSSEVIEELEGGRRAVGGTGGRDGARTCCVELTSRFDVCYEMKKAKVYPRTGNEGPEGE